MLKSVLGDLNLHLSCHVQLPSPEEVHFENNPHVTAPTMPWDLSEEVTSRKKDIAFAIPIG